MDLKSFITSTLLDIMGGVRDAQRQWMDENGGAGLINPAWGGATEDHVKPVIFDVAVTAESGSQGEAGGGIKVWGIGAGAKLSDTEANSTVSRIQFEVPIIPSVIRVDEPTAGPLDLSRVGSPV